MKVDARDRIWLHYSSSIRLSSEMTSAKGVGGNRLVAAPLNIDSVVKLPKCVDRPHPSRKFKHGNHGFRCSASTRVVKAPQVRGPIRGGALGRQTPSR